jgi:type II secretory pathway component PulF
MTASPQEFSTLAKIDVLNRFGIALEYGVPVVKALQLTFEPSSLGRFSNGLTGESVKERLNGGERITNVLRSTTLFSEYDLAVIEAGEESGNLGSALKSLAKFYNEANWTY